MESYTFLRDEAKLNAFLSLLPDTTDDECYLVFLLGRNKYLLENEKAAYNFGQKAVLLRKIAATREKVRRKVLELCVPKDSFTDRNGKPLPEHSLAVYISLQPRSHRRASVSLMKDLADRLYEGSSPRLDMAVFTQLQTNASRKPFLDVDIDVDETALPDVLSRVKTIMGETPLHVLHTRGGAHVLIPKESIDPQVKKGFYQSLIALDKEVEGDVGIDNDSLVPLPGCYQGGFTPYVERLD